MNGDKPQQVQIRIEELIEQLIEIKSVCAMATKQTASVIRNLSEAMQQQNQPKEQNEIKEKTKKQTKKE